jgi:hypothetical protein
MTISGGIKLFDKSSSLIKDGSSIVVSSGASGDNILSMNRELRWDSVGSDDTTTETLTITMPSATIDRIFIVNHNLKDFSITHGAGATAFTSVVGIDGSKSGIVETAFSENTAYYEFDAVAAVTQINISATKTQIVDAQKYITIFVTSEEIGTFVGFPEVRPEINSNAKRAMVQTGKFITQKNFETFGAQLSTEHTEQSDIDLMDTVYERQDPFIMWLCGGKFGTQNFSVDFKNWRLQDVYQVQTFGAMQTTFRNNIYTSSPITNLRVAEEV